jgi:8-oxo-dGTP diphosphatase
MARGAPSRHSVSVAAIVVSDDGRVLITQRRDNARWEPPGGVLEIDESIENGLRREVREETGLVIEPEGLTGVYKNMTQGIVALVFRCHVVDGITRATDEVSQVRWISKDEIEDYMDEAYAIRVLDALSVGLPAVRAHDGRRLLAT